MLFFQVVQHARSPGDLDRILFVSQRVGGPPPAGSNHLEVAANLPCAESMSRSAKAVASCLLVQVRS